MKSKLSKKVKKIPTRPEQLFQMVSSVYTAIIQTEDDWELLQDICKILVKEGGYYAAWVGFAENESNGNHRPVAQIGYPSEKIKELISPEALFQQPSHLPIFKIPSDKPVVTNNIGKNPDFYDLPIQKDQAGITAMVSLPLKIEEQIPAALHILSQQKDAFGDFEVVLLTDLADNISGGIKKLRTYVNLQDVKKDLNSSQERFARILEIADDAIISVNEKQEVILFNRGAEKTFGYTSSEILGKPIDLLLPPQFAQSHREHIKKFAESPEIARLKDNRTEILGIRKDGSDFPAEASISKVKIDSEMILTVMLRDISRRKISEQALRQSEELYKQFVMEDLSGDFVANLDGKITECNSAFLSIFGFKTIGEAKKTNLRQLFPQEYSFENFLEMLKRNRKLKNFELELQRKDERPIFVIANFVGRFDSESRLIEIMGYVFNITDTKKIERQLYQAQKMEAIGRLAGGVAHDFNNTLTAISGFSDLLLDSTEKGSPQYTIIEEIQSATKSATALTKQLLAFSRKQIVQYKVININNIVTKISKMLHRVIGEQIELLTILDERLDNVKTDPGQMEQIIMNLAVNARDAMPDGGKLTIETRNVELDENYVNRHMTVKSGNYVMLAVSDNGIGMDEATQSQIFEPFFTTKKKGKGTGLGLSTVYGIVTQSGGYIWVYSEPGHGSTIKIYIPRVTDGLVKLKSSPIQKKDYAGTETILLVEDDERVRKMIYFVLQSQGYKVIEADNGIKALELSNKFQNNIDMIVTDVVMPEMSGLELANEIKKTRQDIVILYMSGYTDNSIIHHQDLKLGINFLEKPFSANVLSNKVREMLDKK